MTTAIDDLVKRLDNLRDYVRCLDSGSGDAVLYDEAARALEALQAEVEVIERVGTDYADLVIDDALMRMTDADANPVDVREWLKWKLWGEAEESPELHREPQPVGGGWQDISTAPKTRPIVVETEAGRIFKARWVVIGDDAVGWGTVNEDDPCPTCWTDGFCWESNADEEPSDKPVRWCELHKHSPLPSPPELQSEPVGGSNE